jgi:hypothetical protein
MARLAILIPVAFLCCTSVDAQEVQDKGTVKAADRWILSGNGKLMTLEGNVSLSTQRLTVSKADKVVIDETRKL